MALMINSFAQAPEGFTFQAMARDANGKLLVNKSLTIKTTILLGTPGTTVWEMDYPVNTDANGLFTLIIGELGSGTLKSGDFSEIDWGNGTYYLNVKIYYKSKWIDMGTTQLISVPYALNAKAASNFNETDPVYTASEAAKIVSQDISNLNNLSGVNTGDQDLANVLINGNDAGNKSISNLSNPVNGQDAVTKAYVDELINQLCVQIGTKIKDTDGNYYKVVKIGDQVWMAENLKTTKYNDGTAIPYGAGNLGCSLITPAYAWINNNTDNKDTYGALYNCYAVNTNKLCPNGYHMPSDAEWKTLEMALGMTQTAADATQWRGTDQGTQMKATSGWINSGGGTNTSGFSALPAGYRNPYNCSDWPYSQGNWWSSTQGSVEASWFRRMESGYANVYRSYAGWTCGMSVRCVKD